jgi:hypothetical protein
MGVISRNDHLAALSQSRTASGKPYPPVSSEAMSRELRVQVVDDEIIVTLPDFRYSVTYCKPHKSPQLMAKNIVSEDDPRAPTTVSEFLATAWRLANERARELGWIV